MAEVKRIRALLMSTDYEWEQRRLSAKYRNQVARKAQDLTTNPEPGGGRTALSGYSGLFRVRAGDHRIIYAFDDDVVQLLSLRRRNEKTYDDLDEIEVRQFESFKAINGGGGYNIKDWEELAKKWAAPRPPRNTLLPIAITPELLNELEIDGRYREALLCLRTEEDLLGADDVPEDVRESVLECIFPTAPQGQEPTPVVSLSDLIDPIAAAVAGPIDAETPDPREAQEDEMSPTAGRENSGKRDLPVPYKTPRPLSVSTHRKQEPLVPYPGNCARGIGKETRYTVKLDGTIELIYIVGNNERALLITDEHPGLVQLVNEAKRFGGSPQGGGGFFINEYRHVLVPTLDGRVLLAGVYTRDLEFEFDNTTISPFAPRNVRPGKPWPGPHVGIKYTLAAGASNIRYEVETGRGTVRRVELTDFHSASVLGELLGRCRAVKPNGGALYVNEAREVFAPVDDGSGYHRLYIGHLGDKPWFPDPLKTARQ